MKKRDAPPLSRAGRAYVLTVGLVGTAILVYSAVAIVRTAVPLQWVVFAALTLASGRFTLKIPSVDSTLSVSEMFAFSCVLLFGPEAGAVTLALDGLLTSTRFSLRPEKAFFNVGVLALSIWLAGTLFFRAAGVAPLFQNSAASAAGLILPLALLELAYFVSNSGLIAVAVGFQERQPFWTIWRQHYLWLAPSYAAGASVALLLVVSMRQVNFGAIALIPPVLLISYLTLRSSFGRVEDAKQHVLRLNRLYLSTIETLATAIDAKDEVTHGHVRRVQVGAVALARVVGVHDEQMIQAIEAAALLHDTGKIAIPEHILNKPGKLTAAEFEKMKLHAPIGAEILSAIDFPYPVVPIVRHHHENWDGTGYPDGLRGTDIPIGARVLSVVDCFDALTSDRPYRPRMTDEAALAILNERRGTMYDPLIVDIFCRSYRDIMPAPEIVQHPASRAVGGAREAASEPAVPIVPMSADGISDEVLAISSLARAVQGDARLADVGTLTWMMLRSVVPSSAMAIFTIDDERLHVVAEYTVGLHARALGSICKPIGSGVAGWVAVNRHAVVNSDPALDLTIETSLEPPLRSALAVPLVHNGLTAGVLSLYATTASAFTDNHARLLEVMAPTLAASVAAVRQHHPINAPRPGPQAAVRRGTTDLRLLKPRTGGTSA